MKGITSEDGTLLSRLTSSRAHAHEHSGADPACEFLSTDDAIEGRGPATVGHLLCRCSTHKSEDPGYRSVPIKSHVLASGVGSRYTLGWSFDHRPHVTEPQIDLWEEALCFLLGGKVTPICELAV